MDDIQKLLLEQIADLHGIPAGAYNIRSDGLSVGRSVTENINIVSKTDKQGIDIFVKPGTKNETVHIPVIISKTGYNECVYNDFYIGEGADVTIIAGCGIHNCGSGLSEHDGVHSFFISKNARVKYLEKHYGSGDGTGGRVMNPTTVIELDEGAYMEMDTVQIKGIDSTVRVTKASVAANAGVVIREKLMTHGTQLAQTDFTVDLNGDGASANVISRSVARDSSRQIFKSNIHGNAKCSGHSECDAIIMDNAEVSAIPEIIASNVDASLIHEAAIGKIAGEQIVKFMTLGLSEAEAEQKIVQGFLK